LEGHIGRYVIAVILLVGATVAIHAAGSFGLLRLMAARRPRTTKFTYHRGIFALAFIVVLLLLVHLAETVVWALYYAAKGCFPDIVTSIVFSMETYSTVGYGDILLRGNWRLLSGVEALTGVLMISWSTALLLRVVTWVNARMLDRWGLTIPD